MHSDDSSASSTNTRIIHSSIITTCISFIAGVLFSLGMVPLEAARTAPVDDYFHYRFIVPGVLTEAGDMDESSSPYFWVNSGGYLLLGSGLGSTNLGKLPSDNRFRQLYAASNPLDTENGYMPQNIFRLVTRATWDSYWQDVEFKIVDVNLTDTPNRDGYSGVLLMSRYHDGDNLYYAGLRMDGTAVIKKKYRGTYYTLAQTAVFDSPRTYDRLANPNLIPEEEWLRVRLATQTLLDGDVRLTLRLKQGGGDWQTLLTHTDERGGADGDPLLGPAHAGIRTDYLDVLFDDYRLYTLD